MKHNIALIAILASSPALSQDYQIKSFTIAVGGASGQTIGPLVLSGTIGQPNASVPIVAGNLTLIGGFWPTTATPQSCIADLNGDGELDFFDVSLFLTAFAQMSPSADYNSDGLYSFFDVSIFLGAFAAGCP